MSVEQISYIVFIVALVGSLVLDLFVLNPKGKAVAFKSALYQFGFWLAIGLAYGAFIWMEFGAKTAMSYYSAYLMEESLSIDNIFVFILLFNAFKIKETQLGRLLLIGVLLAIVFRIIFIFAGISIIQNFHWVMYLFGAVLMFSGFKMFFQNEESDYKPKESFMYKIMNKYLRIHYDDEDTTFTTHINGKKYYTKLMLVVVLLAFTDIIFAIDSIPAVLAISQDKLIVFSSNIFAILGLRTLFFVLRKAADKFDYLAQGIAIALIYIGIKLLLTYWHIEIADWISFVVILVCIFGSMIVSALFDKKAIPHDDNSTD
ncbi:MAG: TerC/Alx family metal homeostasis membrane protein [Chitinophagaceae bacterium]|nr:TerC/Alx family metal homeostasis membrane protein [Chitinophagaceae bacterium]